MGTGTAHMACGMLGIHHAGGRLMWDDTFGNDTRKRENGRKRTKNMASWYENMGCIAIGSSTFKNSAALRRFKHSMLVWSRPFPLARDCMNKKKK